MQPNALVLSSGPSASVAGFTQVPAAIPIALGDRIGVDDLGASNASGRSAVAGASMDYWIGAPADGTSPPPTFTDPSFELFLNADIEPLNDAELTSVLRNKKAGRGTAIVLLPNPGALLLGSKLVKPKTLEASAPGKVVLDLVPTKKTRKRLIRKGKAAGPVSFTFTPDFGTASTDTVKVGLKLTARKR
jgi:hypothetical protein